MCGWYDLDLRDATGLGHGALVVGAISPAMRDRWLSRLAAGDLVGIAATERRGGSRIQEITTRATLTAGGRWLVSGEKVWVSRLAEAAGLVVFFRDPDGRITAAIIGATAPGLSREHFTRFRPLATATALGTAAGVHTAVAEALAARVRAGVLPRVRDNALITLGRTHAGLTAALLGTLAAVRLGDASDPRADLRARIGKAHGVDTDLAALQYADGIHDSLYRSGGKTLLGAYRSQAATVTTLPVPAEPGTALPASA